MFVVFQSGSCSYSLLISNMALLNFDTICDSSLSPSINYHPITAMSTNHPFILPTGVLVYEMVMASTPFAPKKADNVTELFTNIAMVTVS